MAYNIYCFALFKLKNNNLAAANSMSIIVKIISVTGFCELLVTVCSALMMMLVVVLMYYGLLVEVCWLLVVMNKMVYCFKWW